jgi:sec-independent protein translocase protein TatB
LFDIGWTELVVVAIVAILVVGPKDLPGMLRGFGRTLSSLRRMGRDFQKQFDDALREAELDEVRNISRSKAFKPLEDARKSMESYQQQVRGALSEETSSVAAPAPEPDTKKETAPVAKKTAAPATAKAPPARKTAASAKAKAPARRKTSGAKPAGTPPKPKAKTKAAGSGGKKTSGTK